MSEQASASKRPLWTAVVALALGAAALWGASRLAWLEFPDADRPVEITDGHPEAWLVPLALLALAAIAAVLALGGLARRLLGVLLALAGVAVVVLAFTTTAADLTWYGYGAGVPARSWWPPALAGVGGALVLAAGVLLVLRGHTAPRMGAKYAAPGARKARQPEADDVDLWNALSDGEDPTTMP